MSTVTSAAFIGSTNQEFIGDKVTIEILPDEKKSQDSVIWKQINDILNQSLRNSGLIKVQVEATGPEKEETIRKILVTSGILVGNIEYEERFGGLDLEYYRKQMPPELFEAFVRHIGSVPGKPKIDIVELTSDFEG